MTIIISSSLHHHCIVIILSSSYIISYHHHHHIIIISYHNHNHNHIYWIISIVLSMIDILIIGCSTATVYFLSKEIEHEKVFDVLVKY